VQGNELADQAAKGAADGISSQARDLPKLLRKPLLASKAAVAMVERNKLQERFCKWWRASPRFNRTQRIDPSLPSKAFMKLVKDWPRPHSSILLQLRTGHAPLNKYLHKIGKADSPLCPHCQEQEESVEHFLLLCPALQTLRNQLFGLLFRASRRLDFLLTNPKAAKQVIKFALATKHFRGRPPEPNEDGHRMQERRKHW
jgi:hypothetical protein